MHSFLKAIGFSQISKREEMKKIILDVIKNYDKKNVIQNYPDGTFAEFSRNYGNDCGITVCGQYDEEDRFHVEYYYPFFRGTGVTTQEAVTVEKHVDKNAFSGACDDLRIGITLIFYLQNAAEYMKESGKEKIDNHPLILSGLAGEGKILLPVLKDKEAVKVEQESAKRSSVDYFCFYKKIHEPNRRDNLCTGLCRIYSISFYQIIFLFQAHIQQKFCKLPPHNCNLSDKMS